MDYEGNIMKFSLKGGFEIEEAEDLYSICIDELKHEATELKKIDISFDANNALKFLHNIKGVSGSYYLDDVYTFSLSFYEKVKAGNYDDFSIKANELFDAVYLSADMIKDTFIKIKQTIK